MPTNGDRAQWAEEALNTFMRATRCDRDTALPDLLANLMHWADRQPCDFDEALATARMHHQAEIDEKEED